MAVERFDTVSFCDTDENGNEYFNCRVAPSLLIGLLCAQLYSDVVRRNVSLRQMDDRETVDNFLNSSVLQYTLIRHSTLNGSWYPDVEVIDPLVDYDTMIPSAAFRRHDRGQNLGFRQGVDQGGNGCLWLVYAAQVLRDKGQRDIYHIQRKAQDLKALCAPLATQLASALGKPLDFQAHGVPGDMETVSSLVLQGGLDVLVFVKPLSRFLLISKPGNRGVATMYLDGAHYEALDPESDESCASVTVITAPRLGQKAVLPQPSAQVRSGGRILTKGLGGLWYDDDGFALRMHRARQPKADARLPAAPIMALLPIMALSRTGRDSDIVQVRLHIGRCS